jgi:hypothetical protein
MSAVDQLHALAGAMRQHGITQLEVYEGGLGFKITMPPGQPMQQVKPKPKDEDVAIEDARAAREAAVLRAAPRR